MPAPLELFAACQPGLEPLLVGELQGLGVEPKVQPGGASFRGDHETVLRCGLWLGTASHVVIRLAQFPCRALGELERKAADLPWHAWLRPQVAVAVHVTTKASRIYHTDAAAERITNALAIAFGRKLPNARPDDDMIARIAVRIRDDVCTISLDSTSTPLHRRGYRLDGRKAPLREDIAHALVLASGFTPELALLDPFCGSGTIPIEAAGLAANLAPGRLRPAPLHHLAPFDADAWEAARTWRAPRAPGGKIAGSDRDAGAIGASKANAERAGVANMIEFREGAVTTHPWLQDGGAPERGVLVSNPPFGLRVAKGQSLVPLFQTLGHRAARLGAGWRVALLAHDVRLARRTGLPLHAAFTTRHGGLAVAALLGDAFVAPAAN